jgi:hypothetical protein
MDVESPASTANNADVHTGTFSMTDEIRQANAEIGPRFGLTSDMVRAGGQVAIEQSLARGAGRLVSSMSVRRHMGEHLLHLKERILAGKRAW